MVHHYEYQIGRKGLRDCIDLTAHRQAIERGIHETFNNTINVTVFKDYFEFDLPITAPSQALRRMGKAIIAVSTNLRKQVREYKYTYSSGSPGKSRQLFRRKTK